MAVPLVAAVGSWLWTARAHAVDPARRATNVLVAAFGVKACARGYVVAGVRGMWAGTGAVRAELRGCSIALYAVEGYFLRKFRWKRPVGHSG